MTRLRLTAADTLIDLADIGKAAYSEDNNDVNPSARSDNLKAVIRNVMRRHGKSRMADMIENIASSDRRALG